MKIALIVPGGVDRSGEKRVIPVLLWTIERLAAVAEVHVFALHQEPDPGNWPLLGAEVHNAGRRPIVLRTLSAMLGEQRKGAFDVVHAFWASGPGVVGALFRFLTHTPCVLTLPGGDLCAIDDIGYGGLVTLAGRMRVKLALAGANAILVPSEAMQAQASALGIRSELLRFGVALDRWPLLAPRRREPGSRLHLVHIADLNRVKDLDTLLRAVALLRDRGLDFHLEQLGEDTLEGAVQQKAREMDLAGHITFCGFRSRRDVRRTLENADILVTSSRHEGVPIASIEAAAAGVPTVGTRVGQIADWAPDAALAVPVGDAEGLATAIEDLATDENLRIKLTTAAQSEVLRHDADAYVARLQLIYDRVSGGRRSV